MKAAGQLGFAPKFTTAETFHDFAVGRGSGLLPPDRLAHAVDRLAAVLPGAVSSACRRRS